MVLPIGKNNSLIEYCLSAKDELFVVTFKSNLSLQFAQFLCLDVVQDKILPVNTVGGHLGPKKPRNSLPWNILCIFKK